MKMKIKRLHDDAIIPTYAHITDAAMDLYLYVDSNLRSEKMHLVARDRWTFQTGIAMEIPENYFGLIRPRSGLAVNSGIDTMAGVIDSGYRGEIKVTLINHSKNDFPVEHGMRIAQMLILPVLQPTLEVVSDLSESDRGNSGHGSTGML